MAINVPYMQDSRGKKKTEHLAVFYGNHGLFGSLTYLKVGFSTLILIYQRVQAVQKKCVQTWVALAPFIAPSQRWSDFKP